jgi:hypothetical protein
MKNLEKNEMVLNFDELNKLSQFEQADLVWEIIERLGFKDATMEPNDNGYSIELECEEVVRDEDQLLREIISNGGDISEVCSSYEEILEIDDVNDAEYEFIENIVTNEEASVIIDKYYDLWCETEDGGYIDEGVFELSNFLKNNQ